MINIAHISHQDFCQVLNKVTYNFVYRFYFMLLQGFGNFKVEDQTSLCIRNFNFFTASLIKYGYCTLLYCTVPAREQHLAALPLLPQFYWGHPWSSSLHSL